MSFGAFFREMKATARASKLARREEYEMARSVLEEALRLLPATTSTHEVLALWREIMPFMKPGKTVEAVTTWESWARQYLSWAERGSGP